MSVLITVIMVAISTGPSEERVSPVFVPGSDDVLQYDDGTPWWLTWGGLYRGTWFHTADFYPDPCDFMLGAAEFWFYHHSVYPWDTDEFIVEVWNGEQTGPEELLYDTTVTAAHMTGVIVFPADSILTEPDFWLIENTELSAGGWPAILGDNTPGSADHSFYSDDFIVWEPWVLQGSEANDYLIRAHGSPVDMALESRTWGGIKALF